MSTYAIGIHGGCGTLHRELMTEPEWAESREHLAESLKAGWRILSAGGRAVDAVEAAVRVMEDSHHFNAGHGAALNEVSEHELDASIMDGETHAAGAVCAARTSRNPISAARAVLESGDLVLLAGPAADAFAAAAGVEQVPESYFTTQRRIEALATMKARGLAKSLAFATEAEKHGTVGAVARDARGNLAAATSTGGYNNKPRGRVGDSPIIGAGTYARNGVSAVSCTGQGEWFIKEAAAHDIAARIAYGGETLKQAADRLIFETMRGFGVGAGLVSIGAEGEPYAPFNTLGMYRGWITTDGRISVATHKEVHDLGQVAA